jgi:pyruvate dehydrogenase E1 component beta subunit
MPELNMVDSIRLALQESLRDDPAVMLMGEDIGLNGGVFRATQGLQEQFGPERVLDTPLAEAAIAGIAIGIAAQGLKPVAEIQFMGFLYSTLDQVINHASRLRTRTRGRLSCPMVLRAPFGGGVKAPEHHSESMEALFAHIPGIKLLVPSSPRKAYQLLRQAIADPDPVVFLEPKRLYRAFTEELEGGDDISMERCTIEREGSQLTLVSWGAMMQETLQAADDMLQRGISCEVIDCVSLKPLDTDTIAASVRKTGRLLIVHEAPLSGGFAGEISARISESEFFHLLAPIRRVTGFDTVMPYPRLEKHYMPDPQRITDAAMDLLEYR